MTLNSPSPEQLAALDALSAAITAQRALQSEAWGGLSALRVRMALRTGDVEPRGEHYFGPALLAVIRRHPAESSSNNAAAS